MEAQRKVQVYMGKSAIDGHPAYFIEYHNENFYLVKKKSNVDSEIFSFDLTTVLDSFKEKGIKFTGFLNEVPESNNKPLDQKDFDIISPNKVPEVNNGNSFVYENLPKKAFDAITKQFPADTLEDKVEDNKFEGYGCYVTVGFKPSF